MKVYIAGPMTGYDNLNFPLFNKVEEELSKDYTIVNPARLAESILCVSKDIPRETFLRLDIYHLLICDGIVLLPSWETSRGAVLERDIAKELKLDIYIYKGNGVLEKEQQ